MGRRAQLIAGFGRVFDVEAEGELVFSRHESGRLPEPGEVVATLKAF